MKKNYDEKDSEMVQMKDVSKYTMKYNGTHNSLVHNKGKVFYTPPSSTPKIIPKIDPDNDKLLTRETNVGESKQLIVKNPNHKSVTSICPIAAGGDIAVEEEKNVESVDEVSSSEGFSNLVNEVLGNYMEERVCEHEVLLGYAKYSEEQIKYKSTPTYEKAAAKYEIEKSSCTRDITKHKGNCINNKLLSLIY